MKKEIETEITTLGVYRDDVEELKDLMKKGEFFRDKFHEMVELEKERKKRK